MQITIGTRGSKLALYNTNEVVSKLKEIYKDLDIKIKVIKSLGDIENRNLQELNERGIFTRALEEELLKNHIDIAIHSFKDLPLQSDKELEIVGVLERKNVFDIVITRNGQKLSELATESIIGTSSQRRIFQINKMFNDKKFIFKSIRGNIDTRINKLKKGEYDAIILSGGALPILDGIPYEILDYKVMLPSPAQSAVCFQIRKKDTYLKEMLENISDKKSFTECLMEREVLNILGGGCFNKVAVRYFAESKLLLCRFETESNQYYNIEAVVKEKDEIKKVLRQYINPNNESNS